jgi:hypothetical protein
MRHLRSLRGYLVVRNAMDADWLKDANDALDQHSVDQRDKGGGEPGPASGQPYETAHWRDLSPALRTAAATLGWRDAASWESAAHTPACDVAWCNLTDGQRSAAALLGFRDMPDASWASSAYVAEGQSYGNVGMRRMGTGMAGETGRVLGNLLELPCRGAAAAGRRHPFARMLSCPALLGRIQVCRLCFFIDSLVIGATDSVATQTVCSTEGARGLLAVDDGAGLRGARPAAVCDVDQGDAGPPAARRDPRTRPPLAREPSLLRR